MVAISPQLPDHSARFVEEKDIPFLILSDPRNEVAAAYGVRFHLPPDLLAVNRTLGLDLNAFNGDDSGTLPVPSRFIVDRDGCIRYTVVDPDYTVRPTPEHTLEALRTLR